MNIKRAKQEIMNTIRAYLEKDADGRYRIAPVHQRPVLLMGPPGIGKTQIMEQIAGECDLALVAYTITHHTRQSAIGLPFITEKLYAGEKRPVTEYTMSEIIASVYDRMEQSGKREGILFIDEINCVSETLAPAMLQFLQGKTFGNQKVPEGWIIVAAGNPPEYNKSVRPFDVVTLDRVKVMPVEADYGVWKEYAIETGIHGSILSYLDIHKENFYRIETTVDGKQFVTARGWQDLSEMIYAYERLGYALDRDVVVQYLRHEKTAKDFANYLELYYKYQSTYLVEEILAGFIRPGTLERLKFAPFDERLKVVSLLLARLSDAFRSVYESGEIIDRLFAALTQVKTMVQEGGAPAAALRQVTKELQAAYLQRTAAGQNERFLSAREGKVLRTLEEYALLLCGENDAEQGRSGDRAGLDGMEQIRAAFDARQDALERETDQTHEMLEYAFDFCEAAFGEGQEMVVFITELSLNRFANAFLRENACDRYYMYNKRFLFADQEAQILTQLDALDEL